MYFFVVLTILVIVLIIDDINAFSYCDAKNWNICRGKKQDLHVKCSEKFRKEALGKLRFMYPMTAKLRKRIVHHHNRFRDKVASGTEINATNQKKYPAAKNMRELIWDYELAHVAHIHAHTCNYAHDKCRSTKSFGFPGQNLSLRMVSHREDPIQTIDEAMDLFYSEKDEFPDPMHMGETGAMLPNTGHFTVMMNYQSGRVGCAMSVCEGNYGGEDLQWNYLFSCDYELTNMRHNKKYEFGPPASDCKRFNTTKSKTYKSLCGNNGKVFKYIRG